MHRFCSRSSDKPCQKFKYDLIKNVYIWQDQLRLLQLLCYDCNVLPLIESLFQLGLWRHSISRSCECTGTIWAASLHFWHFKHAIARFVTRRHKNHPVMSQLSHGRQPRKQEGTNKFIKLVIPIQIKYVNSSKNFLQSGLLTAALCSRATEQPGWLPDKFLSLPEATGRIKKCLELSTHHTKPSWETENKPIGM